jgi:hypothetical protein
MYTANQARPIPHEVLDEILSMFGTIRISPTVQRRLNDAAIFLLLIDEYRARWREYVAEVEDSVGVPVEVNIGFPKEENEPRYVVVIDYANRWTYIAEEGEWTQNAGPLTYPADAVVWCHRRA